ncbi:MAG: hypothetical protein ABIF40_05745 [archaeon]
MIARFDLKCKGTGGHVRHIGMDFYDCQGGCLPKNGVDSRLILFLDKLHEHYNSDLYVTSGHRCYQHNLFSYMELAAEGKDPKVINLDSKHITVGELEKCCAVDFVITPYNAKNLSEMVEKDFPILFDEVFEGQYQFNDLFWLKVYEADEGRDLDNQHNQPYIHIQVKDGMENIINMK